MRTKRRYELKKRADEVARTRQRITEAAVELHGSIGPALTTMSAVAKKAGVQRHTVYRHFPDEEALFGACSAHFMAIHPLPNLGPWSEIADPRARLERGLDDLYAYYEQTGAMFTLILRDTQVLEALRRTAEPIQHYFAQAVEVLSVGWPVRGRRRHVLLTALGHAVNLHTWGSLVGEGSIDRAEAITLVSALVEAAAAPKRQARQARPVRSTRTGAADPA
jgi:AcrR family transcriptional regulator